jgi:hypothetical protein
MGAAAVWAGLEYAEKFFMGTADVQHAMRKLVAALEELEIPYAVVGGMALNEYGYRRVTVDVDVLLAKSSLQRFKDHWLGRGYVENKAQGAKRPAGCEADGDLRSRSGVTWRGAKKFPGSRGLRDTELGVTIDVLIAGDYPGDGQPKPVQFPDRRTSRSAARVSRCSRSRS